MSIFNIKKSIRHISRYREIVGVLLKYGFEDVIEQLNINVAVKRLKSKSSKKDQAPHSHKSRAERVRLAFEDLGPSFIKLGQMISTRYDIFPLEYISSLRKLQDNVQPFSSEESMQIIEKELGRPLKELFDRFDREPIAAASIAQVHRARTCDGRDVVVKVQRPDILSIINRDIPILVELAHILERHIPESQVFDPSGLVSQFKKWIGEEMNFILEARNVHRFRRNFAKDKTTYTPQVFWDLTTSRVLTMEYIDGTYIDQVETLREQGMDPKVIAVNGTYFAFRQIFEFHFFHGDPHPSNLMVLPGHVIAPLDYGLMGRLDDVMVNEVSGMLRGIIKNDANLIVRTLVRLNREKVDVDRDELRIDVSDLLARYHAVPLHMLKFETFFNDLVSLIRNHHIRFPRTLYLMGKSLMLIESIAQKLDPEYNIVSIASSYFTPGMIGRSEAETVLRNATTMLEDYSDLVVKAPQMLNQILKKARWGEIGINLHHVRIDDMLHEMDRSANRLSFSMIIASLIVGSSLIIQLDKGPRLWDLPIFGVIGFSLAGLLGLWLIFSILRSGKL